MEGDLFKIDKLLSADQWSTWKFQIRVMLSASDMYDIVNGEKKMPKVEEALKLQEWEKLDRRAQKMIVMSVGPQALVHIMNCATSHAMWNKLESVYEQKAETNIHLIQQRFYSFSKDPSDDIATHISKLESIAHQLKECGESISAIMLITKILMTSPPEYNHFFTAWESTASSDKTIENLTSRLIMEESRLSLQAHVETAATSSALVAKSGTPFSKSHNKSKGKSGKCFFLQEAGPLEKGLSIKVWTWTCCSKGFSW